MKKTGKSLDDQLLQRSFNKMGRVFDAPNAIHVSGVGGNPLYRACLMVTDSMGMTFTSPKLPKNLDLQRIGEWISESAEQSQMASRTIQLQGEWWKSLVTPLVVFHGENQYPMALIPQADESVSLVDPVTEKALFLDHLNAQEIYPLAFTFYRPFPEKLSKLKQALSFGIEAGHRELITIFLAGLFAGLIGLLLPFANQVLFDYVVPNVNLSLFWQTALMLAVMSLGYFVFDVVRSFSVLRFRGIFEHSIQAALWERLLRLPSKFYNKFSTGDLIQRLTFIDQVRPFLLGKASYALFEAPFTLAYLALMMAYSVKLTLLALLLFALIGIIVYFALRRLLPILKVTLEKDAKLQSFLVQMAAGIAKLRITASENRTFIQWANGFASAERLRYRSAGIELLFEVISALLPVVAVGLLYATVISMLKGGESTYQGLTVGKFIAFQSAFLLFTANVSNLINTLVSFVQIIPYWNRTRVILKESPEQPRNKHRVSKLKGDIRVEGLTFRYAGASKPALENISFSCKPGSFLGIIGPSGSGKSTILRCLIGLEKLSEGKVFFDDYNLHELDFMTLRRRVGSILQTTHVFSSTVKENILIGRSCSLKTFEKALKVSCFDEVLENLPMGLDTVLPSGGRTLSGGERQRLLLARALISDPDIMLLDEATSALDVITQHNVQHQLEALKMTRIVVAHRLETVEKADHILFIEGGRITAQGTFKELKDQGVIA